MFKWVCLALGVGFLSVLTWMVNDVRLKVRRTAEVVGETGETLNERLPEILNRTLLVTETVSELATDVRNVKAAIGKSPLAKGDEELSAYASGVIEAVEKSGATVGLKPTVGKALKKPVTAREWAVGARREAALLTRLVKSKKDVALKLTTNLLGSPWQMQLGEERVPMLDWLKRNHPPTKALFE